ncbi:MAG: restriction endonuclease subunit S [Treponema succinifaciens]|uniref:restriction endonuclease subunit S n=2 Tax=Treponema TaxID=157 RepID=UPI002A758722|nr:restriction endonuclease subunit S [Treponema succinifaciens]MDY2616423.1 restriction endonuclease subunit S [Treponema succinifaciens]
MKNWKYKRLSECSNFISERTSNITIDNYISTENMIENRGGVKIASTLPDVKSTSAYKPNDILLSNIRPYFCKIWFADKKGSCSNDVLVVRAKKEIDPKFLYYVLSDQNFFNWDSITSKGTKMPRGTPNAIMKYSVPDIPLRTQQKIASILSAYDNLIQNYKKQIEALQTAASELYKEWFVRFRFPGYKNSRFENGIPEGWKIERLGNLFEITSSKRVFEEDYVNEGIPFYRSKEIIELSNNQEITTELFISNELYAKFKNKFGVPKENDILITSVGSIGNSYQVRKDDIFYFKDGNLTWIKSSSKKALSKYLIYWLKSDLGKNTLISSTIGTSQSALTIEKLRAIKILVPEVNILEKFEQKISSFDIKIQILNKQITNLTQQRDLLLPRLMSDKLEV